VRLPSFPRLGYGLAWALRADGRAAVARRIAIRARAGTHDAEQAERLEELLESAEPDSEAGVELVSDPDPDPVPEPEPEFESEFPPEL
jgi:hypothetical protein